MIRRKTRIASSLVPLASVFIDKFFSRPSQTCSPSIELATIRNKCFLPALYG